MWKLALRPPLVALIIESHMQIGCLLPCMNPYSSLVMQKSHTLFRATMCISYSLLGNQVYFISKFRFLYPKYRINHEICLGSGFMNMEIPESRISRFHTTFSLATSCGHIVSVSKVKIFKYLWNYRGKSCGQIPYRARIHFLFWLIVKLNRYIQELTWS